MRSGAVEVLLSDGAVHSVMPESDCWAAGLLARYVAEGGEVAPVPPVPARRVGTPREFLDLFTDPEKLAFFAAKSQSVEFELWWAEASIGEFSLDHPKTAVGLVGLVQAGILTQARADEIHGADFNAS